MESAKRFSRNKFPNHAVSKVYTDYDASVGTCVKIIYLANYNFPSRKDTVRHILEVISFNRGSSFPRIFRYLRISKELEISTINELISIFLNILPIMYFEISRVVIL